MIEQSATNDIAHPPRIMDELREVHGDWLVVGVIQRNRAWARKSCVIVQEQTDPETRDRLLLVELRPDAGRLKATLILPFGLHFRKGVVLQIDDGNRTPALPFSTALPLGRFVDLDIDVPRIMRLKSGKTLYIHATTANDAQPIRFDISLNGFAAALARAESIVG